jgi:serine/threonine-protein kinase
LQTALAASYTLERELGRGGMATVFLAQDLRHERPVALKVLHPDLARTLGPERFQREIKLAARLQHPHILTVHDSGEAAGQLWFTMPYVEGESLRDRLRRERQLPVDDALRITREAAQALQYAHDRGVVHRDIKPENLLLTADGNTLVADFGIARSLAGEDHLTQTGLSVGTPAYMSPEQASGDKALDARTDIYSLATVLYEMLVGEPPFTGPSAQAIIVKRLTEPVPAVHKARPSVPPGIDQAIQRALAPIAADRFATVAEFARALQSASTVATGVPAALATTVAASASATSATLPAPPVARRRVPVAALAMGLGFLVGLGVLFAWRRSHPGADDTAGPKRVAVLPFENLGDSSQAYFADGVGDEIRGKLSQVAGLAVIARASSNEYRHTTKPPQQIARELGADYLLTATVRWEKHPDGTSRVRVSPELVRVEPGAAPTTKWQQGFDAALTDVFQVQADIAGQVAGALNVALGDSGRRELAAQPTANLAAYDAFLKGEAASVGLSAFDPPSLRRAIGFYEQAVALDSTFVAAWSQLARTRAALYRNGTPDPQMARAAQEAAERTRRLAPNRVESYLASVSYLRGIENDFQQAHEVGAAGLKLAPNNAELLSDVSFIEVNLGRWEEAVSRLRHACALDPRSATAARRLALALQNLRRYDSADSAADRALELGPTNLFSRQIKVELALARGDLPGARRRVREALAAVDPSAVVVFFAQFDDLYWVLEDAEQQRLLTLPPSAFDDDRAAWGLVRAQTYGLRGNPKLDRVYADSARIALEAQLHATPADAQRRVLLGLALAYMGRTGESIQQGERAVVLLPISRDAVLGPYLQHVLARIYLMAGQPEQALDHLEALLKVPYILSPGWLRIDPTFAPLKGNPRFERLIAGS